MREGNPTEWKNIVGLMKGTSVWAEVQKLYPELKDDDDIADEVLTTFSGRRGAERLCAEQQKIVQGDGSVFEKTAAVGAISRVKQALSKFWKGVADFLGIHYTSAFKSKKKGISQRVMEIKDPLLPTSVTYSGEFLSSDAKIPTLFEISESSFKNVADGGIMFRDGDMGLEETIIKMKVEVSQAAQKATENLNLGGRVVVHESAEGLEGREATAKGWYDIRTGQIHVVLSNNADAADVTQTILHEAVAHHGLRELFGHNVMDAFLDSVLAAASQEVKDAINELRRGNGWNFRTATEEYLVGLAERTDFERMTAEERGLFATIRRLFNHALEFLGLKKHELSDRELAYILWCSYQNLKTGEKGRYVVEAERIAMRYKLKAGKNAMTDTEKKVSFNRIWNHKQTSVSIMNLHATRMAKWIRMKYYILADRRV